MNGDGWYVVYRRNDGFTGAKWCSTQQRAECLYADFGSYRDADGQVIAFTTLLVTDDWVAARELIYRERGDAHGSPEYVDWARAVLVYRTHREEKHLPCQGCRRLNAQVNKTMNRFLLRYGYAPADVLDA